ncbi:ABC transporter permease [Macrococcus brunensis]|uniref:ABC transporter permease n=1 Tax=Macrococcus brunensis TaxID=198483 RepID=A0A4R6BBK1_9STAP|nr:ABC transporter permease [Macrococcus brunensis]TDL94345.1 ABC transporter permease [Macrococcus brunensis]ULG74196.1 ABC transporter permease [Macrococcus brunensis]
MTKFMTTFSMTYLKKVTSKSFIITTLILMLIVIALSNIDKVIDFFDHSEDEVTAVAADKDLQNAFIAAYKQADKDRKIEKVTLTEGKKGVEDDRFKQLIDIKESDGKLKATLYSKDGGDRAAVEPVLTSLQSSRVAQTLDLTPAEVTALTAPADINETLLGQQKNEVDDSEKFINTAVVYIGLFLIFMISLNYANQIATEIAMEKSSRVIEMIVTSVSPVNHMMAKIVAIIAVALTQILAVALTILVCLYAFDLKDVLQSFDLSFGPGTVRVIIYAVIFLLLGLLMNVSVSAIIGALTNRVEDIAQAVMPVTFINLAAFYIAIFNLTTPDNMLVKVTSYIPFFTPIVMLLRTLSSQTGDFEIIAGIIISIITIVLSLLLAARIYKGSVFSYGKGLVNNFRQALTMK